MQRAPRCHPGLPPAHSWPCAGHRGYGLGARVRAGDACPTPEADPHPRSTSRSWGHLSFLSPVPRGPVNQGTGDLSCLGGGRARAGTAVSRRGVQAAGHLLSVASHVCAVRGTCPGRGSWWGRWRRLTRGSPGGAEGSAGDGSFRGSRDPTGPGAGVSHALGQCKAQLLPVAGCEQGPCSSTVETVQWEGACGRLAPGPALHPDHSAPPSPDCRPGGCRSTFTVTGRRREGEAEGPAGPPLPAASRPRRLAEQARPVGPQMRPGRGWRSPCWPRVQGLGRPPTPPI